MDIVDLVHLDQIFKQHEDHIAEQAGLTAEGRIYELGENHCHQLIEVRCVLENLGCLQESDIVRYFLHSFCQNIGLIGYADVDLDVVSVLF